MHAASPRSKFKPSAIYKGLLGADKPFLRTEEKAPRWAPKDKILQPGTMIKVWVLRGVMAGGACNFQHCW